MRSCRAVTQPVAVALIEADALSSAAPREVAPLLSPVADESSRFRVVLGAGDVRRAQRTTPLVEAVILPRTARMDLDACARIDRGAASIADCARVAAALRNARFAHRLIAGWLGLPDPSAAHRLAWLGSAAADRYLIERVDDPSNALTLAHIRLLTRLPPAGQRAFAERVVAGGWSVRRLKQEIDADRWQGSADMGASTPGDADLGKYARDLSERLGSAVAVRRTGPGYEVAVGYATMSGLAGLFEKIGAAPMPEHREPVAARELVIRFVDSGEVDTLLGHLVAEQG